MPAEVHGARAYLITSWKLGRYYRTYPAYVEDEVHGGARRPEQFERGPPCSTSAAPTTDDAPLHRRRRPLRLGALARRRLPIRAPLQRPARMNGARMNGARMNGARMNGAWVNEARVNPVQAVSSRCLRISGYTSRLALAPKMQSMWP